MLSLKQKTKIIEKFRAHPKDTGSAEVQVGLLTEEIKRLADHLKSHPKDHHSRRGLLGMVNQRRKLLEYLARENPRKHNAVAKKLKLVK